MKTGLVWFKNDLRIHDNEALTRAVEQCEQLVFFFYVEPHLFENLKLGFRKSDINRFKFLEQSANALKEKLENNGGHLIVSDKSAVEIIPRLIQEYAISSVYGETEYASEELNLVKQVQDKLPEVEFNFYWGKTLYHIDDIPFTIDKIPLTSKAYRIPAAKESDPRTTFETPKEFKSHPNAVSTEFPTFTKYGFTEEEYNAAQPYLKGGEEKALERLQHYTFESENLTGYRWSRNKSLGMDYSSKFSPYLALGCISARTIYETVKKYETEIKKNQSTWWLVFELVWRDYFTFKGMKFGNKIFHTKGFKNKDVAFENDSEKFKRWQDGKTGIPFIDAHMRQLNETGYMSNRGRVNCASYFVHDLKIDWTWGAAYFESKLIDYDVSANWLNWHVQAFEIYYTNPVNQGLKYKANEYIAKWIPELRHIDDNKILAPWIFKEELKDLDYPVPIEVFSKWTRAMNLIKNSVSIQGKLF
ncbi:DASH family cryptochrome [Brumimicrobium glaciale]|uniref:Cryptochrome DASH n=1 Tax=Brumimicrobium glaciale TaxID=200475 RepID=A0A4Q4KS01_9FLAO|nr:DASH family cryptochrome [Brumimicrobium glaciale]RYM35795.1 DASH family cryptochrome [Brumimicrobium glaciale]